MNFFVVRRDRDTEAAGAAAAQDGGWAGGLCRVPALAKEEIHRFRYKFFDPIALLLFFLFVMNVLVLFYF